MNFPEVDNWSAVLNGDQEEMEKMGSERNVKSSHQNNNPVYICLNFWQFGGFWGLEVLVLPFKARTLLRFRV